MALHTVLNSLTVKILTRKNLAWPYGHGSYLLIYAISVSYLLLILATVVNVLETCFCLYCLIKFCTYNIRDICFELCTTDALVLQCHRRRGKRFTFTLCVWWLGKRLHSFISQRPNCHMSTLYAKHCWANCKFLAFFLPLPYGNARLSPIAELQLCMNMTENIQVVFLGHSELQ